MKTDKTGMFILALVGFALLAGALLGQWFRSQGGGQSLPLSAMGSPGPLQSYQRAVYDPLHFRPAIETARDEQCLACHREVLDEGLRAESPAGVRGETSKAWYQQLSTYSGGQETFHRRHLVTPLARELMALSCNTCHQGHDPREEAPGGSATGLSRDDPATTLRKQVNVENTCLLCHGRMPVELMGLPGAWPEYKEVFGNSCLTCHDTLRTSRHQVSYLRAEAIEAAGRTNSDVCYGCHGGRAWYRLAYPYARHAWPGMPPEVPEWAKNRPTESESRFRPGK